MPTKIKKILVAEDDKFLSKIYTAKLAKEGFEVISAYDGEEAMQKLKDKVQPDIILLDIIMPKKNGFEVLEEVKKDSKFKKIPVLILSNLGQDEDLKRGVKLGAKDYIIKASTSIEDVVKMIKKYI